MVTYDMGIILLEMQSHMKLIQNEFTDDSFLVDRLRLLQPKKGFVYEIDSK